MQSIVLTLISIFTFTLPFFAQNDHTHCAHHCMVQLELEGPRASSEPLQIRAFESFGLTHYIGSTHQHSGFSDGYPGTTPADYFQSGIDKGFDFVFGADHSDSYILPLTLHDACLSPDLIDCISINPANPLALLKWKEFADIVEEKKSETFVPVRGFEWTSDRFGHINVYFSQNITNAKQDGGYVAMETFWSWFTTEPMNMMGTEPLLGGIGAADGLGVFNHPGDKSLDDNDPGFNWNQFEYIAEADSQMVGIEVFNDGRDYAADGRSFYQEILDAGWHVGAIASEDHHDLDWNNQEDEKTIIMAESLTTEGLKDAMSKRRTYAVRDFNLRMEYFAGNAIMGSRLERETGSKVYLQGRVYSEFDFVIELVSNEGEIISTFNDSSFIFPVIVTDDEKWYYLRVANPENNRTMAYSSPIWIKGGGTDVDEDPTTGLEEITKNEVRIYPNPSNLGSEVKIRVDSQEQVSKLQLLDLRGQLMAADFHKHGGEFHLSTESLSQGSYQLMVLLENGSMSIHQVVVR